jgi:hypothetical protein
MLSSLDPDLIQASAYAGLILVQRVMNYRA